jgi:hypothetical protein
MQFTVQTITDSAIDLADMRNSQFIDQSGVAGTELIRYVNLAYRDVYNQIVMAKENYFSIPYVISVVSGTDAYPLPTDFYKLNGVDLALDNSGRFLTLRPFMFAERNKFRSGLAWTVAPFGQVFRYLVVANTIRFLPIPSQINNVTLWYTPEPPVITSLSQSIQLPIGCDEYMSLYVGAMMLSKEESDVTNLNAKRVEVLNQLLNTLKERDQGAPSYIIDETSINAGALYPITGIN